MKKCLSGDGFWVFLKIKTRMNISEWLLKVTCEEYKESHMIYKEDDWISLEDRD